MGGEGRPRTGYARRGKGGVWEAKAPEMTREVGWDGWVQREKGHGGRAGGRAGGGGARGGGGGGG